MKTTAIVLAGIGLVILLAGLIAIPLNAPGYGIAASSVPFFAAAGTLALIHRLRSRRGPQLE